MTWQEHSSQEATEGSSKTNDSSDRTHSHQTV